MNCKNCGAVLSPNSTICSMCGTPVKNEMPTNEDNIKQDVLEIIPNESEVTVAPSAEPVQQPAVEVPVETPIVEINESIVQPPVQNINNNNPVVENNSINNVEVAKKENNTLFYIILAVLSIAIVGSVIYLLFFANK